MFESRSGNFLSCPVTLVDTMSLRLGRRASICLVPSWFRANSKMILIKLEYDGKGGCHRSAMWLTVSERHVFNF